MTKGIEPQAVTDAVEGTITWFEKHTPKPVKKLALQAADKTGAALFGPPPPVRDREAGQ
jgi:hypothetical protein